MKKLIVTMLIIFSVIPAYSATKIAFVDMKKVWDSSKEIKLQKTKLKKLVAQKQKAIKQKESELKALQQKAQTEMAVATDEAKRAMAKEYQQKMMEYQQLYQEAQKILQNKDIKAQASFINKVKKIASQIAKKRGYSLVLAKEQVIYIQQNNDITNEVIKKINK